MQRLANKTRRARFRICLATARARGRQFRAFTITHEQKDKNKSPKVSLRLRKRKRPPLDKGALAEHARARALGGQSAAETYRRSNPRLVADTCRKARAGLSVRRRRTRG